MKLDVKLRPDHGGWKQRDSAGLGLSKGRHSIYKNTLEERLNLYQREREKWNGECRVLTPDSTKDLWLSLLYMWKGIGEFYRTMVPILSQRIRQGKWTRL